MKLIIIRLIKAKLWASLFVLEPSMKCFHIFFSFWTNWIFLFANKIWAKNIFWLFSPWVLLIYRYLHIRRNVIIPNWMSDFHPGEAQRWILTPHSIELSLICYVANDSEHYIKQMILNPNIFLTDLFHKQVQFSLVGILHS